MTPPRPSCNWSDFSCSKNLISNGPLSLRLLGGRIGEDEKRTKAGVILHSVLYIENIVGNL
jgi:hypothetical protein